MGISMRRAIATAAIAATSALMLAGCSKQGTSQNAGPQGVPTSAAALSNPSNFPLYQPSTLVSVAPFDQAALAQTFNAKVPPGKPKMTPYKGDEVLASTSSSLSDLKAWLQKEKSAPPQGLKAESVPSSAGSGQAVNFADKFGADAAMFTGDNGRSVIVIAMDPKTVHEKLGPALSVIDKYMALPAMVRGAVDQKAQDRFGVSVSQMLDKNSPVGLFVSAVKELGTTDQRALLLIDATRE